MITALVFVGLMMISEAQAKASSRYESKTYRPRVVLNPDNDIERKIINAIRDDSMSFSERAKQLLKQHYKID